jgi:hypothetical protein
MGGCFFLVPGLSKGFLLTFPSMKESEYLLPYLAYSLLQFHIRMSVDVCNGGCSDSTSVCQKTYAILVALIPHPYVISRMQWWLL